MKKMIKMSLAAAIATAGFSTAATAGGLEEAIKGVSIKGKIEVEYDYTKDKNANTTTNSWDYDWDISAKIPVNDMVTANVSAEGDNRTDTEATIDSDNVNVTKTYFTYSNGAVTAMVGKMGMAGAPWFDDERANGVVAMYNAGPVVLAAGYFNGSNANVLSSGLNTTAAVAPDATKLKADGTAADATSGRVTLEDADIAALAAIAPNIAGSGINASLWYAQISGISAEIVNNDKDSSVLATALIDADSYSVNVNGKIAMIGLDVTYTDTDYKSTTALVDGEASLLKVIASADLGMASVYLGYGATDDNQHVAGVDLTSDSDSKIDFGSEQLSIDELPDADAFIIGATVPMDAWTFGLSYVDGETGNTDFDETLLEIDYKMSKNFNIGAHYSVAEVGNQEDVDAAVSLEYKF